MRQRSNKGSCCMFNHLKLSEMQISVRLNVNPYSLYIVVDILLTQGATQIQYLLLIRGGGAVGRSDVFHLLH